MRGTGAVSPSRRPGVDAGCSSAALGVVAARPPPQLAPPATQGRRWGCGRRGGRDSGGGVGLALPAGSRTTAVEGGGEQRARTRARRGRGSPGEEKPGDGRGR